MHTSAHLPPYVLPHSRRRYNQQFTDVQGIMQDIIYVCAQTRASFNDEHETNRYDEAVEVMPDVSPNQELMLRGRPGVRRGSTRP